MAGAALALPEDRAVVGARGRARQRLTAGGAGPGQARLARRAARGRRVRACVPPLVITPIPPPCIAWRAARPHDRTRYCFRAGTRYQRDPHRSQTRLALDESGMYATGGRVTRHGVPLCAECARLTTAAGWQPRCGEWCFSVHHIHPTRGIQVVGRLLQENLHYSTKVESALFRCLIITLHVLHTSPQIPHTTRLHCDGYCHDLGLLS